MGQRFTVQADSERECAAGLQLLLSLGLRVGMPPRMLTDGRWMARAMPGMAKAPTCDGQGQELPG